MSNSDPSDGTPYSPIPPKSPKLTMEQWKDTVRFFKEVFEDSSLATYIKLAGITGAIIALVEVVRGLVDLWNHYHR